MTNIVIGEKHVTEPFLTDVHMLGAICADRGIGAAIIMPTVNTEAMNEHLMEISRQASSPKYKPRVPSSTPTQSRSAPPLTLQSPVRKRLPIGRFR
jgi:hypothetical protein